MKQVSDELCMMIWTLDAIQSHNVYVCYLRTLILCLWHGDVGYENVMYLVMFQVGIIIIDFTWMLATYEGSGKSSQE